MGFDWKEMFSETSKQVRDGFGEIKKQVNQIVDSDLPEFPKNNRPWACKCGQVVDSKYEFCPKCGTSKKEIIREFLSQQANQELDTGRKQIDYLQNENQTLKRENQALEHRINTLNGQCNDLRNNLEDENRRYKILSQKYIELEDNLRDERNSFNDLSQKYHALQNEYQQLKVQSEKATSYKERTESPHQQKDTPSQKTQKNTRESHKEESKKTYTDIFSGEDIHFPPFHFQEISKTSYARPDLYESELDQARRNLRAGINFLVTTGTMQGQYNLAIQALRGDCEPEEILVEEGLYRSIGNFEISYRIYQEMQKEQYHSYISKDQYGRLSPFYDGYIIKEFLDGLDLPILSKYEYTATQMQENEREEYPSTLEAIEYLRNHANSNRNKTAKEWNDALFENLKTMERNGDAVKAHAYAGEFYFFDKNYQDAAAEFTDAAKSARNVAVYYGFAGNSLLKSTYERPKEEINILIHIKASILNHRAISLDYMNPRWHLYQALILEHIAVDYSERIKSSSDRFVLDLLTGSLDEFNLALALVKDTQKSLKGSIEKGRNNHLKVFGDVSLQNKL